MVSMHSLYLFDWAIPWTIASTILYALIRKLTAPFFKGKFYRVHGLGLDFPNSRCMSERSVYNRVSKLIHNHSIDRSGRSLVAYIQHFFQNRSEWTKLTFENVMNGTNAQRAKVVWSGKSRTMSCETVPYVACFWLNTKDNAMYARKVLLSCTKVSSNAGFTLVELSTIWHSERAKVLWKAPKNVIHSKNKYVALQSFWLCALYACSFAAESCLECFASTLQLPSIYSDCSVSHGVDREPQTLDMTYFSSENIFIKSREMYYGKD